MKHTYKTTLRVIRRLGVGGGTRIHNHNRNQHRNHNRKLNRKPQSGTQRGPGRGTQDGEEDFSPVCLSLSGPQRGHSGDTAGTGTRDAGRRGGFFASLPQLQPDSHKDSHSDSHSDSHARTRFDLLTSLARTHDTPCTTRDA